VWGGAFWLKIVGIPELWVSGLDFTIDIGTKLKADMATHVSLQCIYLDVSMVAR
jgi:hypothetical protein